MDVLRGDAIAASTRKLSVNGLWYDCEENGLVISDELPMPDVPALLGGSTLSPAAQKVDEVQMGIYMADIWSRVSRLYGLDSPAIGSLIQDASRINYSNGLGIALTLVPGLKALKISSTEDLDVPEFSRTVAALASWWGTNRHYHTDVPGPLSSLEQVSFKLEGVFYEDELMKALGSLVVLYGSLPSIKELSCLRPVSGRFRLRASRQTFCCKIPKH